MIDFSYVGQYLYTPPNGNELTFNFSSIPEEYFTSTSHYQYLPIGRTTLVLPIKPSVTGVSEGRSSNFNWNSIISQYISNTRSNNFNWSGSTYNLFNISDTRLRYFNSSINTIKQYLPTIKTIAKEPSSRSNSFNWEREKPAPTYTYANTLADPYFASVVLGMHMDGIDNGTTFTDITGKTVTRSAAVTKTGTKVLGTASGYFNGSSYLTVPNSSAWAFGSGDFTIECYIYIAATSSLPHVITGMWGSGGYAWELLVSGDTTQIIFSVNGTTYFLWAGPIGLTTWRHIAVTRNGNIWRLFVDGVIKHQVTNSLTINTSTFVLEVGRNNRSSTWYLNGYIDDLRITKGVARYTSNFTTPTIPFANNSTDIIPVSPSYNLFNSYIDKTPSFNESRISYNLFNNSEIKTAINTSSTRSINLTTPIRTLQFNSAKPETHCIRN